MRWCRQIGCTQPITKGQLFDALLQVVEETARGCCCRQSKRMDMCNTQPAPLLPLPLPLQHGEGAGAWTIDALVEEATKTAGGTPLSGTNEVAWLTAFLEARHNLLQR